MSGRRHRDDDWDDARHAPADGRRDGWTDDAPDGWAPDGRVPDGRVPDGWADRGRSGGGDRAAGDRGVNDRGPGDRAAGDRGFHGRNTGDRGRGERGPADRGISDLQAGDRGFSDRGLADQVAGDIDFADWFVDGGKRRGGAPGGSAPVSGAPGGGGRGGGAHAAPGGNGLGGYRGPDYPGQGPGDAGRGQSRPDRGGYGDPGYGDYRPARDYRDQGRDFRDATRLDDFGSGAGGRHNGSASRHEASPEFTPAVSPPPASGGNSSGRPHGRLSIFTLLDDKAGEFDQLAERVADAVRSLEPDTLVYVIHVVPKAPMQRIIYEIYTDRAAFEAHERQPHIQQFVADCKSCVLATNIINLRLKYAKVAPFGGPGAGGDASGIAPPASDQGSLPAAAQRVPRELEPGGRAAGEDRYASAGNGRYRGPGDGGYQDSRGGRHAAAGSARYADGGGRYADDDNDWFGDQGNGNRRPGGGDRGPGGGRGQSQYPGQRYGD